MYIETEKYILTEDMRYNKKFYKVIAGMLYSFSRDGIGTYIKHII